MMEKFDTIIVGGGIVGLATAHVLSNQNVLVLEKESNVGEHQSGRNSGVIHSGIYYKPGSVKAVTCRLGKKILENFCETNKIPIRKCGKVIVATDESEFNRLDDLLERGKQNGVQCEMIDAKALRKIEPYSAGERAVYVPETGIVDYKEVCAKIRGLTRVQNCQKVVSIDSVKGEVRTDKDIFFADRIINCGGLYADKIAKICGVKPDLQIVPFRGIYYTLKESVRFLCKTLIYPVPDPQFPFLGVHFTSTIDGGVEVGPNAVLALGREAYKFRNINIRETIEILTYSGALKLFAKHWKMGLKEMWMSISKERYVKELKRLVPFIKSSDLLPRVSGIRAQAVDNDGNLIDDFRLVRCEKVLHVLNAPSPAATAAFAIGERIADTFK